MNSFLSGVIFCCQKGLFPPETALQSCRLSVLDIYVKLGILNASVWKIIYIKEKLG